MEHTRESFMAPHSWVTLMGRESFVNHPWFNETSDFINLEGAGAGGRPLLLRSTSTRVAKAWGHVTHPHALVMSADAFNRGLVKSGTDYSVYQKAGREGLDFAFYRQRSKYHTKEDSIPSLNGKAALWSMMESSLKAGLALTNDESTKGNSVPVYFDRKLSLLFCRGTVLTQLSVWRGACGCASADLLHHQHRPSCRRAPHCWRAHFRCVQAEQAVLGAIWLGSRSNCSRCRRWPHYWTRHDLCTRQQICMSSLLFQMQY